MLIAYPYNPTTQDLWLYADHTVTWSVPTSGSAAAKIPVAWNPNSPLYGYRNSLRGITTRLRTWSNFCGSVLADDFSTWNDPNLESNKPVFYNSYPMQFTVVSQRFMYGCRHCYAVGGARNPALTYVPNIFPADSQSANATMFRWLDSDDTVIQTIAATNVLRGFSTDPPTNLTCPNDLALFETTVDIEAPPMIIADVRTIARSKTLWILDSNQKIVRLEQSLSCVEGGRDRYQFKGVKPDGSAAPVLPHEFLHDSGSIVLAEIYPPTSAAAGDGVMGLVPAHVVSSGQLVDPFFAVYGYEDLQADGDFANSASSPTNIRSYMASRGYPMPSVDTAQRQDTNALETVDQQILSLLESF